MVGLRDTAQGNRITHTLHTPRSALFSPVMATPVTAFFLVVFSFSLVCIRLILLPFQFSLAILGVPFRCPRILGSLGTVAFF